jgi:hypothetical protein
MEMTAQICTRVFFGVVFPERVRELFARERAVAMQ